MQRYGKVSAETNEKTCFFEFGYAEPHPIL